MEVRELLLLTPPHHNQGPNQPPNRSQSQGTLTSAIRAEVFCHLLYALDSIQPNSTWVMVCTHLPNFFCSRVHSKHVPCEHCSCILV